MWKIWQNTVRGGLPERMTMWTDKKRKKRKTAKFVSVRRGFLSRPVIQPYSEPLRNSGSTASWEVWEGRLTRLTGSVDLFRAPLRVMTEWQDGEVCGRAVYFKWFKRTAAPSESRADVKQMRVVKPDDFILPLNEIVAGVHFLPAPRTTLQTMHNKLPLIAAGCECCLAAHVNNDRHQWTGTLSHSMNDMQREWARGETAWNGRGKQAGRGLK